MEKPKNMDAYIAGFPKETQVVLQQLRALIRQLVPEAAETISYAMPTFTLNNTYLIYFAGYKHHIGLYPAPVEVDEFKEDFAPYKTGKGTLQLPLKQPLPVDLITRIVQYRVKQNSTRAKGNKK